MNVVLAVLAAAFACGWFATFWVMRRDRRTLSDEAQVHETELARLSAATAAAQRVQSAFDALPDGVVVTDPDGAVVFRNGAAFRFVDARHSDAVVESAIAELAATALANERGERDLELFGPPRRVLSLRSQRILHGVHTVGAVVWVRDVSDARRVEDMRRDFVANVSHELRTPVGALGLLAETMADEPDIEVMRRFAEQMEREAVRLGNIIEDLLDLSVIESNDVPAFQAVNVGDVVHAAVANVRGAAEVANIALHVVPCEHDLWVLGDRRQLVSAIYNLLDNAVKYSDPNSAVRIRASHTATDVTIEVRDNGIGIPTRDLQRVFERFYRVDRARSRETGGTGLGLAIVRHVVGVHGGTVTLQSHEGEGSAFAVTLPIADEQQVREHHG